MIFYKLLIAFFVFVCLCCSSVFAYHVFLCLLRKIVLVVLGALTGLGVVILFLYCLALLCELKDRAGTRNKMEMKELDERNRALREQRREEQRQQQRERVHEREREQERAQKKKRSTELEQLRAGAGNSASSSDTL